MPLPVQVGGKDWLFTFCQLCPVACPVISRTFFPHWALQQIVTILRAGCLSYVYLFVIVRAILIFIPAFRIRNSRRANHNRYE